ncbi:RagB/SusD family nutrient uptake outer membrane protein [Dyadobacter helix]|nr:RagB/SusD family nutrient uptake outer membrane protein [Dyadobacter sp. CECT 9275]
MRPYSFLIAFVLILSVSACTEIINQVPPSALTETTFFKTANDAEAAVTASYDAIQGDDPRWIVWGDARCDNLEVPVDIIGITDPTVLEFTQDNISTSSTYATWNKFFVSINRVNNILAKVPAIQDPSINAVRDRILGEAYFLRAFNYFFLTRLWGAVPLVLEPTISLNVDLKVSRVPAEVVLDQIVADLKEAESKLPVSYSANLDTRGRATKGAAQALLARVYLWKSSYNKTNEWQSVVDYTTKVIASPVYSLAPGASYASIFTAKNTAESIWELQYNYNNQELNTLVRLFIPRSTKVQTGGEQILIPSKKIENAFVNGDLRKAGAIFYSDSLSTYKNVRSVAKYQGTIVGASRFSDSNFIILRLADVILMKAEAQAQLGKVTEAIDLLNTIRKRAGLPNTTATTKEAVLIAIEEERFIELCFEGHRWYDLLRTGRVKAVLNTDKKALLPVHINDILINPNLLPQNPGY